MFDVIMLLITGRVVKYIGRTFKSVDLLFVYRSSIACLRGGAASLVNKSKACFVKMKSNSEHYISHCLFGCLFVKIIFGFLNVYVGWAGA